MGRVRFVAVVLGCVLVVGCVTDGDTVEPKVTSSVEVETTVEGGRLCPSRGSDVILRTGATAMLTLRSARITKSCRCRDTSPAQWSCAERCSDGNNPTVCERLADEPVPLPKTSATVHPSTCMAVVVERGASESHVLVRCPTPTDAEVSIVVDGLDASRRRLVFTADGQCPAERAPDAHAEDDADTDAGPADTDAGPADTDAAMQE